jgi:hypothetical protein
MSGQQQINARWRLDAPLELDWRDAAVCKLRPDLPWTPDVEPDAVDLSQMRVLCSECPVRQRCADYGLSQPGGFYAGVWTPWQDGGPRGSASAKAARWSARMALRWVRDSATHVLVSTPEARSRVSERPRSLSR